MQMLGSRQGMGGQGASQGGYDEGGGYDAAPRRASAPPARPAARPAAPAPAAAPMAPQPAAPASSGFDDMDDDIPF
jgi:single-strand DNA-binding protein